MSNVNGVITRVLFPAFSTIQTDIKKIRENYLTLTKAIAIVVFPLMIFVIVLAPDIVLLFFGKKWLPIVPIMRLLSFVGILQSMINPIGILYLSLGKPHIQFLWEVVVTIVSLTAFILGVSKGVIVVTEYYTIAVIILFYPALKIVFRYIELNFTEFLKAISKELIITLCLGGLVYLVRFNVISEYSVVFLGLYFVVGSVLYIFILGYLEKNFIKVMLSKFMK